MQDINYDKYIHTEHAHTCVCHIYVIFRNNMNLTRDTQIPAFKT